MKGINVSKPFCIAALFGLFLFLGMSNAIALEAGWVNVKGTVRYNGAPLCAMVLINGQYRFSCEAGDDFGKYDMDVPLDGNSQITIQVFVAGLAPFLQTMDAPVADVDIAMQKSYQLVQDGSWILYDDFSSGSIDPAKWSIDDSSATITIENGEAKFVHQAGNPNDSSWLRFAEPERILAVKAKISVGTCAGDVRARIGGNILDDSSGDIVWQTLQLEDGRDRISQYIEVEEPGTYNSLHEVQYAEFETPIQISGNAFYASVVFGLPFLQATVDGYGTLMYKPEDFTSNSVNAPFLGIGTRSTNGDGPCTAYFDDVFVIYKD